ncbi:hypothetical protein KSP39_PZI011193 [Platanthera zijinensis]|uniref:Tf2-1-like SH3-like domain-containing protein n=1 Tax=Platanthera zijinensis TaxID=2320716 RepID=A0AAP0G5S1_9ASPA
MSIAVLHIREKLSVAQEPYKKYANRQRVDLELAVGDMLFWKVSRMPSVKRFGRNHKLDLRYARPFQIVECIRVSTYKLILPATFPGVHDVFHWLIRPGEARRGAGEARRPEPCNVQRGTGGPRALSLVKSSEKEAFEPKTLIHKLTSCRVRQIEKQSALTARTRGLSTTGLGTNQNQVHITKSP